MKFLNIGYPNFLMRVIFKPRRNLLNNLILKIFSLENIPTSELPFLFRYYNYDAYLLNGYG